MLAVQNQWSADARTRRVTLNLLRYATCCPSEVRVVADRLAANAWEWVTVSKADAEVIYGLVDQDLVERAKREFNVDLSSIVDHRNADAECKLCGHQHLRWEFLARNEAGGRDHWMGSVCIETYGLQVDGEATAEAALAKLRGAIAQAKKKIEREEWQAEHPAHVEDFAVVNRIVGVLGTRIPSQVWEALGWRWGRGTADKQLLKSAKALAKYYASNGFLTESKTANLPPVLIVARRMLAEYDGALAGTVVSKARAHWDKFIAEHPNMNDYQRRQVGYFRERNLDPAGLYDWNRKLIAEIEEQHAIPTPPPPGAAKKVVPTDDQSDLPF